MFVLTYIIRLADGVPLWRRPTTADVVISGIMTVLFGLVLGRAWFGPDDEVKPKARAK
jgi:uncharacterized membrane protein HdeD (DUF308 family)